MRRWRLAEPGSAEAEATFVRAAGVVRSAKSQGLKSLAELTTPAAALRRLRDFLLMPHPPLLFKEGNVRTETVWQFVHTLYDRRLYSDSRQTRTLQGAIKTRGHKPLLQNPRRANAGVKLIDIMIFLTSTTRVEDFIKPE